jgi:pimeloyl-ACP methyl ester carboxylesterase
VHHARYQESLLAVLQAGELDALRAIPAMLVYGMEDRAIAPEWAMEDFRLLFPGAPVVELPGVGHFCQEDAPETLIAMIHQFIQMNP